MHEEATIDEVDRALAGAEPALTRLVQKLTPVIQSRVARVLFRRTGAAARCRIRQEVEDFTQEVFLVLLTDGNKVLRRWEPERGLSLLNFVGLVAERQTASILRNGKRNPWKEDPTLPEDFLQAAAPEPGPEEITASREEWRLLLDRLTEELSPLGRHLFDLLYQRELSPQEVAQQTGMSLGAIYAWQTRLRRLCRRLLDEMSES